MFNDKYITRKKHSTASCRIHTTENLDDCDREESVWGELSAMYSTPTMLRLVRLTMAKTPLASPAPRLDLLHTFPGLLTTSYLLSGIRYSATDITHGWQYKMCRRWSSRLYHTGAVEWESRTSRPRENRIDSLQSSKNESSCHCIRHAALSDGFRICLPGRTIKIALMSSACHSFHFLLGSEMEKSISMSLIHTKPSFS
jgi:hypothetical protein